MVAKAVESGSLETFCDKFATIIADLNQPILQQCLTSVMIVWGFTKS